ncbi:hypothetical protein JTB14_030225 [Gonioctena quinquepunctata]|nr:hypothetical protein JTB14_030225 [Gonioctena quinquepunctata]
MHFAYAQEEIFTNLNHISNQLNPLNNVSDIVISTSDGQQLLNHKRCRPRIVRQDEEEGREGNTGRKLKTEAVEFIGSSQNLNLLNIEDVKLKPEIFMTKEICHKY